MSKDQLPKWVIRARKLFYAVCTMVLFAIIAGAIIGTTMGISDYVRGAINAL